MGGMMSSEIVDMIELGLNMVEAMGDCSNVEHKVNPDNFLWKNIASQGGLTLQRDCLSGLCRLVDDNRIQKANGSLAAMKEKMERLLSDEFLRPGDVIGISRGVYEHYGIYAGNGKVIHYAGETSDFNGRVTIHEAPFKEFLKNDKDYFVVSFGGARPVKIHSATNFVASSLFSYANNEWKKYYSPEETLKRAYSRLGETKYSLIQNNCEHFALWCKTGCSESTQVSTIARCVLQ